MATRVRIDKELEKSSNNFSVIITDSNKEAGYVPIVGNSQYVGSDGTGAIGVHTLPSGGGSVVAENGLSVESGKVILGQAVDAVGDPAKLLSHREIPLDGKEFTFLEEAAGNVLLLRLKGKTGDGTTKALLEFTNGETYGTAPNGIFQITFGTDKLLRFWAKDGTNGWINVATFKPTGDVSVYKSLFIEQHAQTGNSLYEVRQDPGDGQTDVLRIQRSGTSTTGGADAAYTLLEIDAPLRSADTDPQESTISLCRKFSTRNEFLDVFNNGYPSGTYPSMDMGLRVQRRGSGAVLRDFVIQYASGIDSVVDILRMTPITVNGSGQVTDLDAKFSVGKWVMKGGTKQRFNDADNSNYVDVQAATAIGTNFTLTLPAAAGKNTQSLRTDASGNLSFDWGVTTYKTAAYTATIADEVIFCNFSSNAAITLFAATGNAGKRIVVKRIAGAGNVTITPNGSETIDGSANKVIYVVNDLYELISDGTNWFCINRAFYSGSSTGDLGTLTWTGTTAPSGTIVKKYRWSRVGDLTTFEYWFSATSQGNSITKVVFDLPSNVPYPIDWAATNVIQYAGTGFLATSVSGLSNNNKVNLVRTGTNTWQINHESGSNNLTYFCGCITFRSQSGTGSV